jgi:hypothetical protein
MIEKIGAKDWSGATDAYMAVEKAIRTIGEQVDKSCKVVR